MRCASPLRFSRLRSSPSDTDACASADTVVHTQLPSRAMAAAAPGAGPARRRALAAVPRGPVRRLEAHRGARGADDDDDAACWCVCAPPPRSGAGMCPTIDVTFGNDDNTALDHAFVVEGGRASERLGESPRRGVEALVLLL